MLPLKAQGCRHGIFGPKEDLAVVSVVPVSQHMASFSQKFSLWQHLALNTYQLIYSACLDTFGPVLILCPFLLSLAFQIAIHDCLLWQRLQKKYSLNEKEKSIRKSHLSAKRPLISGKFKEHRSERGCGAFPTPSQQCVRL